MELKNMQGTQLSKLFIGTLLWVCFISAQPRLTLTLEDSTYLLRQPIWITANLINTTSQTVQYEFFLFEDPDIQVTLWDSKGQIYGFNGMIINHGGSQVKRLNPGSGVMKVGNLLDNYGIREYSYPLWKYLPRETYHISAYFTLIGGETVYSDTGTFSVTEPQGIQKEQHDLIKNARTARLLHRDYKLEAELYDSLLTRYRNSPYEDMILYELAKSPVKPKDLREEILNKLIDTHPQSHYAERVVKGKADDYWYRGKRQDAVDYLRGIINKYPNSRVGNKARELLLDKSR
jgi:hypothetical protein